MVDKKVLEDGKVLQAMIERFFEEQSNIRMMQLLDCLTDCQVVLPCNMRISDEDLKKLKDTRVGEEVRFDSELGFTPDNLITLDNHRFIPIFSNENIADPEYIKHFTCLHMYVSDIMKHYDNIKGEAEGFLLDYSIGIKGELIDVMKKICEEKENGTFTRE